MNPGDAKELIKYFTKVVPLGPERVEGPEDVRKITLEDELLFTQTKIDKALRCARLREY